jgi:hypothetical protein
MRNADSWGLAFIVLGTAAAMWALPAQPARNGHTVAQTPALDVPANTIDYKITVATKRIPAECKTLGPESDSSLISHCQSLTAHGTQMTMVPVDATIQLANQPAE